MTSINCHETVWHSNSFILIHVVHVQEWTGPTMWSPFFTTILYDANFSYNQKQPFCICFTVWLVITMLTILHSLPLPTRTIKNVVSIVCNLHQVPSNSLQNLHVHCVVMTPHFAGYDLKCLANKLRETVYPAAIGPRHQKVTGLSSV